ncbi:MAG: hypothetical protein P4M08_15225 [Oligoflexia bacterium]|nr:hypothetical protein [Oligoflexia bacterium]
MFASILFILLFGQGCGAPTPDPSSTDGQQQILDAVDMALTNQDCSTALNLILPLYNSANTDNEIRLKTASAYGCAAGVNFFSLTSTLLSNVTNLAPPTFWSYMAQLFPSTAGADHKMEGAFYGTDALQSVLNNGVIILPANQVNSGTYNVGSVFSNDRTLDSNLYLIYMAMAGIGTAESRYGNPDPVTHNKGNALPWTTAAAMTEDGCGLAASVLNFLDATTSSASSLSASLANALTSNQALIYAGIAQACAYGCSNSLPAGAVDIAVYNPNGTWQASGCTMASPCSACPSTLRNRSSCTAQSSDVNSCAAAGIINFINSAVAGWQ